MKGLTNCNLHLVAFFDWISQILCVLTGTSPGPWTPTRRKGTRARRWRWAAHTLRRRRSTSPSWMRPATRALCPTWLAELHKLTWQSWWESPAVALVLCRGAACRSHRGPPAEGVLMGPVSWLLCTDKCLFCFAEHSQLFYPSERSVMAEECACRETREEREKLL